MAIRLRPHHLLCMLTFVGKGYSPAFVANFEQVLDRIAAGKEAIEVVEGPDDICSPLLNEAACHCRDTSVELRDRRAAESIGQLLELPLYAGTYLEIGYERFNVLRKAFAEGTIRQACSGCQWKPLCDGIAQDGFRQSRLAGER